MSTSSSFWARNISLPYPSNDIACILFLTIYGSSFLGKLEIFDSKTDALLTTLWLDKNLISDLAGSIETRDSDMLGQMILSHYNVLRASDLIDPEKRQKTEIVRR